MIYGNVDSDRAQDRRGNERESEEIEEVKSAILYTCARLLKLQFLGRLNVGFWNKERTVNLILLRVRWICSQTLNTLMNKN